MSAACLGTALLLTAAGPALAHADLVATSPAQGDTLARAPSGVQLTFSEAVSAEYAFASVTVGGVLGPPLEVVQGADPQTVVVDVDELRAAGRWRTDFRVTSVDGHTIEGQVDFQVTSGPVMEAVDRDPPAGAGRGSGRTGSVVVVTVVVLAVLVAVRLRLRSRRSR